MKSAIAAKVCSFASRCGAWRAPGDQLDFDRRPHIGPERASAAHRCHRDHRRLAGQDGHADAWKEPGDVEIAKPRIQPGVVPAAERDVHVAVIAGQALAQIAGLVGVPASGGCWRCSPPRRRSAPPRRSGRQMAAGSHGHARALSCRARVWPRQPCLYRRQSGVGGRPSPATGDTRIYRCDRAAIRMADQHRLLDPGAAQHLRQYGCGPRAACRSSGGAGWSGPTFP